MLRSRRISSWVLGLSMCTATSLVAQVSQADLTHALRGSRMADVHADLQGTEVTLTGTVNLLADKMEAEKKARKVKGVTGVQDEIKVNAGEVSDADLMQKLGKALTYDRIGYGTTSTLR